MADHGQEDNQRGGGSGWSPASKRPKLPKAPPQRGLGVAQLEKILRDQQQNTIECIENKASFRGPFSYIIRSVPNPHHSPLIPPPSVTMPPLMTPMNNISSTSSITRHVPSFQNFDHFAPPPFPTTTLTGSYSCNSFSGGGGGVYEIGGSTKNFLGNEKFPTMRSSYKSNFTREIPKLDYGFQHPIYLLEKMDPNWPSYLMLQSKHFLYPFSKMVGIKQQWPFPLDDQPGPFSPKKLLPCFPNMYKPDTPSSCGSHSGISFEPRKEMFRDSKKGGKSKMNPKKSFTNCSNLDANFLRLGPPTTSSQSTQTSNKEVTEFDFLQFQGSIDDPHQWLGQGGSSHQKPFYNFLPLKNEAAGRGAETSSSLDNRNDETDRNNVDLSLNLSLGGFKKD
ncbi:hypothetical protein F0562_018346 [Nyssa sinensis]|uniref:SPOROCYTELESS-like EAR-containing protein 1 n=1 Tax=Nyssa sinensis TaxID=561372 RepID=A0A5J4ZD32_9ASTE|nr:hypothetical protein F0562_018346 [Nyssa sinensis]